MTLVFEVFFYYDTFETSMDSSEFLRERIRYHWIDGTVVVAGVIL